MFSVSTPARVNKSAISSGFFGRSTNSRSQLTENFMRRRYSCELLQEPQIVLAEVANVRDVEQNHCQPVHAQTEREAAPLFGIVSFIAARFIDLLEHRRMNHARTGDFDPALAAFERFRLHINFQPRLREWE